jgi:predicted amidohydrolase YtcJ
VRSAAELLDRVAEFAKTRPADGVVHGHGWDESTWADQTRRPPGELDRAAAGRRVYLSQASVQLGLGVDVAAGRGGGR